MSTWPAPYQQRLELRDDDGKEAGSRVWRRLLELRPQLGGSAGAGAVGEVEDYIPVSIPVAR